MSLVIFCTRLFEVCFNTGIGLYHKDTIPNDVYDGRMVFYNALFLDKKLFTLHLSVFAIFLFLLKVLTLILSLLCQRALQGFVLFKTFVIPVYL